MKQNNYFEYASPMHLELKRLGYGLLIHPTDQDILITQLILNSKYSQLAEFCFLLNEYQYRDISKSAIRVYAYYINNPSQFNHDPHNVIGSCIRQLYNSAMSFLICIHKQNLGEPIKARNKTIKQFQEQCISIWLPSAKALASRVKRNTELKELLEEKDLNHNARIHIEMFNQA